MDWSGPAILFLSAILALVCNYAGFLQGRAFERKLHEKEKIDNTDVSELKHLPEPGGVDDTGRFVRSV